MNEFHEHIIPHLQTVVPEPIQRICPCGEATSWSVVYCLELVDGTHLFVKGTPRQRKEALVTLHLGSLSSTAVPHVLNPDLLPTASWQWFLLKDAGGSPVTVLTLPQAVEVAETLGQLQHATERDLVLPSLLTDCSANRLHFHILAVCRWALAEQMLSWRTELLHLMRFLEQAHTLFADLAGVLSEVPASIIHGDVWTENLVLTAHGVRFLDWGDAL